MDFFKKINNFNFIFYFSYFFKFSFFLFFIFIFIIFFLGLNLGLDFKGGIQIEMKFKNFYDFNILNKEFHNLDIKNFSLQRYGSDKEFLLNITEFDLNNKNKILNLINNYFNVDELNKCLEIRRSEYIGSVVSDKLYDDGSFSIFLAMLAMMLYITFRFNYKFALCAIIALFHDMIFLIGVISLFKIEFTLNVFASLMAILGYSINDTVVIFDRIRENMIELKKYDLYIIINESINKTLSRTLMTSFTTLLVVIILIIFGGNSLFYFSIILFFGIIIGTYSSIFIAPYCIYLFSKYINFFIKEDIVDETP